MRLPVVAILASLLLAASAGAQSTSFTFQGRLKDGADPASGLHDFRFRLFDAASGGAQVGATQCVDDVPVSEGMFAAVLDFGQQFASPAPRFLEIEVRRDTGLGCASPTGFVALAPRQALSAVPLANHAKSAFALDAANGSIPSAVLVDNAGRVGIGTPAPTHSVHVAKPEPTISLQDTDSSGASGGQQVGYLSYRDSSNVERAWIGYGSPGDPDISIINARPGGDIVLNSLGSGRVGIGTAVPTAELDVRGTIRLGSSGQLFATSAGANLRIIRGTVDNNGAILAGEGFGVTRLAAGTYRLNFLTPFPSAPTITVTPEEDAEQLSVDFFIAGVFAVTPTSAEVRSLVTSVNLGFYGTRDNTRFHFTAIGTRYAV
ncbi:MAG: hypothetical protein AB7O66_25750, partial [Limisphaerales bacterium]